MRTADQPRDEDLDEAAQNTEVADAELEDGLTRAEDGTVAEGPADDE